MLTCQIETFERALPELRPIFALHWQEYALFQDRMPLDPQFDEYVRRERAGLLLLATARLNGEIVGYYVVQVAPGFHYKATLTAHMDIMYITQSMKGSGVCYPLLRCVEGELKRRQVKVWYSGWKSHRPLGMARLHALLGFQPADTMVVKWLGEET